MGKYLIVLITLVMLLSCSVKYYVAYETYLSQSPTKSLSFEDDRFRFDFLPTPNGVFFNIKNLTQTAATIVWDRSYFIDPENNSSKLLNTDVMLEEEETKSKAKYQSIIAPGANFRRFTTSALNVDKQKIMKEEVKINYSEIFGSGRLTTLENSEYDTFISYGRYWPDIGYASKSKLNDGLNRIKDYVSYSNNMGIGFSIQLNENLYDYKFDFKFERVSVYKKSTEDYYVEKTKQKTELELVAAMSEENSWIWKKKRTK